MKLVKCKHLVGLRFGRGGAKEKMLKMRVDPAMSMKPKDGEKLWRVDPDMSMKTQ
jgi:hypothetical protein